MMKKYQDITGDKFAHLLKSVKAIINLGEIFPSYALVLHLLLKY